MGCCGFELADLAISNKEKTQSMRKNQANMHIHK